MTRFRTVTWEDPSPVRILGGARSGLELWRAIAAGELPPPPVARLLGFDDITTVEEGQSCSRWRRPRSTSTRSGPSGHTGFSLLYHREYRR